MKKINSLLLILLFCSTTLMAQVNLKNGLVACYPFSSNANDESGNNNDGTINGATLATDRFGKVNSAYSFNGTSDYIEVNADKLQNPTFSYAIWVKPKSLPQSLSAFFIFSVGSESGDQVIGLNYGYANGTDGFTGGGYVAVGENAFCQKGSLPTVNQWYHVVLVRDANTYKVYLDGSLMCSTTTLTKPPFYGTGIVKATIGSRNNYGQFADCVLDDIHLYNRAINADEVKALFDGNTPQTITIASNNSAPCGGDNITFTANGATNTSKYQWKVDDINQGINSKTFDYIPTKTTGNYSVKISVEVTDEEVCFPQKTVITNQNITIKDCNINLKSGLVACYPFNANANDESSNGNNGTVNGATLTTDRFGKVNSAYNFDGSSYIALPSDKFAFNEYSYAVWINISANPTFGDAYRILSIGGNCGDQDINVGNNYFANGSGISGIGGGGYNISTPTTNSGVVAGTLPMVGQWYHGVITRDKNEIRLYVNGIFIRSVSTNGTLPYYGCDGTVFANIGTRSTQTQSFVGNIDDIHLYNRAINADEVKALYDGNTPQTITIASNNSAPCGGDNITFTATGASTTAKYQWKVNDVNVGVQTTSNTFSYNSPTKSTDYQVKISVEISDDEICFPNKIILKEDYFTIKNCTFCINSLLICYPFYVTKTK